MTRPPATVLRLLVQLPAVIAAPFIFGTWPTMTGGLLAFVLACAGLWAGRRVFERVATPEERQQDLRDRVDSND